MIDNISEIVSSGEIDIVKLICASYGPIDFRNITSLSYIYQNPPNLSAKKIQENVLKDIEVLQHYYEFEIDRFAFHRPNLNPHILAWYVQIDNLINCNDRLYFHYFEEEKPDVLNVTYLSDSNHLWKFGHPLDVNFDEVKKLHVLMHPYSWSRLGYRNYGNFVSLIKERNFADENT